MLTEKREPVCKYCGRHDDPNTSSPTTTRTSRKSTACSGTDFGTDTTGAAALREFRDETGRTAVLHNLRWGHSHAVRMHPELFTTNCHMVKDNVHYVTFYVPGAPVWTVDLEEVIPGTEPTKCAEWKWRTLGEVASYLLDREWTGREVLTDLLRDISTIPREKTQWMPIPELLAHKNDLGIVW